MKKLTITEQILLLIIWKLKDEAYGFNIRELYCEYTNSNVGFGTLYNNLEQLVIKEYVKSFKGEPTSVRGGKRKVYYEVTDFGKEALQKARELQNRIWEGVPEFISK